MFQFERNCSDNERDNDNGTSRAHVNYFNAITKLSGDDGELERSARVRALKRKQQFKLRQCKSDSNVRRCSEIDKMGSKVSRSRSFDNVETDSIMYESLLSAKSVKKDEKSLCSLEDSEDDYKLLETSDDEKDSSSEADVDVDANIKSVNCITNKAGITSDLDGHDTAENRISESKIENINCIHQAPRVISSAGNEIESDLLCKKYSTLPRVKIKKGNVDHDQLGVRSSVPNKSFTDNRAHCSKEITSENEKQVQVNDGVTASNSTDTSEVPGDGMSDKTDDLETFRSTTLPKTRSRLKESLFRHSLRQAIDSTTPRKHFRISDASEHSAIIIPDIVESASGTDPKRTRRNLSWLRKSMKKLNPFQLPQVNNEPQSDTPVASTSQINPCGEASFEKSSTIAQEIVTRRDSSEEVVQPCSSNPDLFNIVLTEQQRNIDLSRPRQYGRRSNPVGISPFAIESSNNGAARIIAHHQQERRPASAPVQRLPENSAASNSNSAHRSRCLPSEPSSLATSRNSSPVSIASSTGSSSVADGITETEVRPRFVASNSDDADAADNAEESKTTWPHSLSRPICCLFCTLGLFNISRFAIFSVHFGANFLVQFLILSFIFGIPLLWLQMVLGQKIRGGVVTLFRITPICKGIGVALMIAHCIISLYSSVCIGWLLIYLRDSVISADMRYLWQERFDSFRGFQNVSALRLSENIADYFNGVVLQRLSAVSNTHDGKMRFQLAFNVCVVWILVFIMLCRGIRSLGQIIIGIAMFSFLGLTAVCIKFLTLLSFETIQDIFPATDWQEFFANSNSWSVAAQEAFLTWGLLGVSVYTMYCKTGENQRLNQHVLRREALLVVFLTFFGLFLGAVLGSTCIIILKLNGFNYYPASFENPKNDIFLWPAQQATLPSFHHSIPSKWITRYSNIIGESFERPIFVNQQGVQVYKESGYKTLRLVTEMLPATLAISARIEPIWGIIAFAALFLFGLGQLGIMWKPISGAIGNSTSAVLLSCITGLFLGFPLTTDNGIVIIHFMDFIFGGAWWLLILWTSYIIAIFMVRGSPFTSDILVKELRLTETLSAFLAFSWNVLLPVALVLLSVMEYKKSHSNELFHQRNIPSLNHLANWPLWSKQLGGFLQLSLLILVPCVSLIQIYIYLTKGPPDILDRIELLFRPPMETQDPTISHLPIRRLCQQTTNLSLPVVVPLASESPVNMIEDAPPKYSPPPSYSRAVGLRVAKALRNSIRRSIRRFRRSDEVRSENVESNVPTISSSIPDSVQPFAQGLRIGSQTINRNVQEFIRSSIHRAARATSSQSVENLMLSDISLNDSSRNSLGNLI